MRRSSVGRAAWVGLATAVAGVLCGSAVAPSPLRAEFPRLSMETDWPWWRGPERSGHAPASAAPPVRFSDTQHVVWKVPVPGRGHSSPTVVGSRVFLTTADEPRQVQSVLALDRATGRSLWKTDLSQGGFPQTHPKNTHATPTVACDGERLFVTLHHHDTLEAVALDLNGKQVWRRSLGEFHPQRYEYGYAPSPVLYRETVIVAAEYDGQSHLTALRRDTGEVVWQTPRPSNITFSTPSLHPLGGRDVLTLSGAEQVACYDAATGRPLWSVAGTTAATCGTIVWEGDLIFASGGYPKAETVAVREAVGPGEPRGEVVWKNQQKCYEQSMLVHAGYLYALTDNGVLYCFRAADGQEMWRERLEGPVSASPVLAGGHIYWANERGKHYVFKPNPERCELVAENRLGDESFASPAVSGRHLFLRVATGAGAARQEFLYCLGE